MVIKGILQGLIIGIPHRLSGTLGAQERGILGEQSESAPGAY